MALPGSGKTFDQFRVDDAECWEFALSQASGTTAEQAATDAAMRSAVLGTVIGAAAGAAIGERHGAGVGAGTGLLVGSMAGAGALRLLPTAPSDATIMPTSNACTSGVSMVPLPAYDRGGTLHLSACP